MSVTAWCSSVNTLTSSARARTRKSGGRDRRLCIIWGFVIGGVKCAGFVFGCSSRSCSVLVLRAVARFRRCPTEAATRRRCQMLLAARRTLSRVARMTLFISVTRAAPASRRSRIVSTAAPTIIAKSARQTRRSVVLMISSCVMRAACSRIRRRARMAARWIAATRAGQVSRTATALTP